MRTLLITAIIGLCANPLLSQTGDCPYPIIFLHGYTGSQSTFSGTYNNSDFQNIWGTQSDVFHAVLNAQSSTDIWGDDGVPNNSDDDVLVFFNNESNNLSPGCVYSINFENWWNENESNPQIILNTCDAPSFFDSNSNESSIYKQGYALGQMIQKVLNANAGKDKVIVVGHSMGGLETREYLQRQEGGSHIWWVNPGSPDGHEIKKMITTATPHRGSNFFGNPWPFAPQGHDTGERNGLPDINSESVRDLRYSYAFDPFDPFNCGIFGSCPGPYLFGGDEDMPWGYWNHDINCDGDENDPIIGINQTGSPNEWDGTIDNPAIPLPTNLRYTWITSDIGTGGDLVVSLERQWLFSGGAPVPSDGTPFRLTDTLLTDVNHLAVDDDVNVVVRGLDEADYPKWSWKINLDNSSPYIGVAQARSQSAPESPISSDPDWFKVFIPGDTNDNICIELTPVTALAGQLDFFKNIPPDYTQMSTNGDMTQTFNAGSGLVTITLSPGEYTAGGNNYIRVIHDNVASPSWVDPYTINVITKQPVPVELVNFNGRVVGNHIELNWTTGYELNSEKFQVLKSIDGHRYEIIDDLTAQGSSSELTHYSAIDENPSIGLNYYRLKQFDNNGQSYNSDVIAITYEKKDEVTVTAFPNPSKDLVFIQLLNSPISGLKHVEIFNSLGKLIYRETISEGELKEIRTMDWPKGHYVVKCIDGTTTVSTTWIKS